MACCALRSREEYMRGTHHQKIASEVRAAIFLFSFLVPAALAVCGQEPCRCRHGIARESWFTHSLLSTLSLKTRLLSNRMQWSLKSGGRSS